MNSTIDVNTLEPRGATGLRGMPASAGVIIGLVRIVRNEQDASRVRHGEIVVCNVVTAEILALFGVAGGVIAESGGTLSNPAIVARECRIPAVFAVKGATQRLLDGQHAIIDGTCGRITVIDSAESR